MIEVGRVCLKIAGRDAGLKCVVVEVLDKNFVMIDGQTRRRKCNMIHLHPLADKLKIKAKASHDVVVNAFKDELKIEITEKKKKTRAEKPKKTRKIKVVPEGSEAPKEEKKAEKKPVKKEAKKEEKPKKAKTAKKSEKSIDDLAEKK